jgi:hypothetical protein
MVLAFGEEKERMLHADLERIDRAIMDERNVARRGRLEKARADTLAAAREVTELVERMRWGLNNFASKSGDSVR